MTPIIFTSSEKEPRPWAEFGWLAFLLAGCAISIDHVVLAGRQGDVKVWDYHFCPGYFL